MKHLAGILFILFAFFMSSYAQSHNDDINVLLNRADSASNAKNYKYALKIYVSVGEMTKAKRSDAELRTYVRSQINAAECCYNLDCYEEAWGMYDGLMNLPLTESEKKKVESGYSYSGLFYGVLLMNKTNKQYKKARQVFEKIRPYSGEQVLKQINQRVPKTFYAEAVFKDTNFDYIGAKECYDEASRLYEEAGDNEMLMICQLNIADMYFELSELKKSENIYIRVYNLAKSLNNELYVFKSLKSLTKIYKTYNDMERYSMVSNKLDSIAAVTDNSEIKESFYLEAGDELTYSSNYYSLAEYYYHKYESLVKEEYDESEKMSKLTIFYGKMRELNRYRGNKNDAIKYGNKSIELYAKQYPTSNCLRYMPYMMQSILYAEAKDSVNFERCNDSIDVAIELGMNSPTFLSYIYMSRGLGYESFDDYEKSYNLYLKSDSVQSLNNYSIPYVNMLTLVKEFRSLEKNGRYDEALKLSNNNVERELKLYGMNSEQYCKALYRHADIIFHMGDILKAFQLYVESTDILKNIIRNQLRYISSFDRINYWRNLYELLITMSSFAVETGHVNDKYTKECYDTHIFSKSLLLESERSLFNIFKLNGTEEDINDYTEMLSLKVKLKELSKNTKDNKAAIEKVHRKFVSIDDKLTKKSKEYSNYTSFLNVTYDDVRKKLGRKDILIDFVDFDLKGEHYYAAYIIKRNNKYPLIKKVFTECQLDSLLNGANMDFLYNQSVAGKAVSIILPDLTGYVKEGSTVYFVPSGVLHEISVSSLPMSDGTLLGEHYNFVRLSSARSLFDYKRNLDGENTAVLYGGLQYDVDAYKMAVESAKYKTKPIWLMRGLRNSNEVFKYLPETKVEAQDISQILKSHGYNVKSYMGSEGTEESFINLSNNSPQILHIATHGFYYKPEEADKYDILKGTTDAMFLSGLIFSGGNAAWQGKELPHGVLGGVVTAENISCLNFSNTDMVVLSACQTGKGLVPDEKISRNEGIFGLQRAFKKAGVRTIVMSLWDVSDVVSRKFMTEFYNNLFVHKYSKRVAFNKAKTYIRKQYPEPLYWAGFVMVD